MAAVTEIFHTGAIPHKARLQYWNRVASTTFGAMHIEPVSSLFTGCMKRRIFRGLELATIESTPVSVEGLSNSSHRGIFLLLNQRGSSRLQQRGQQTQLRAGELTALYAHEPYLIESSQQHLTHILYLPGRPAEGALEAHIAVAHPADECDLLSTFIRRLAALDGKQPGPGNPLQTARDLVELNWPSSRKRHSRIGAEAWEQHLRQYVEQHLGEPQLNAQCIADALGITARYVQKIFERMQTTASQYILECRLQQVADRLSSGTVSRISDLALEAGFSDLSHFCRRFRDRFGVSAREYRASRHQAR